jgi:tetratricopeptide (TPR) repeat protein
MPDTPDTPQRQSNQNGQSNQGGQGGRSARTGKALARKPLTFVLLAGAAAVLAAAIYLAVSPPKPPPPPPAAPSISQAQEVRRHVEGLLARGDQVDPKAGAASLLIKRQAYEGACEVATSFIRFADRSDIIVRPLLAETQVRLGRMAEAERTVDDLLGLAPTSAAGLWLKGELLQARGAGGAMDFFRRAAESSQAGPEIWARYGSLALRRGEWDQAESYLARAEKAGQADGTTLRGLAFLAQRAGKFARAEELLQRLADARKGDPAVLAMLAMAQKDADKLPQAEKTLRQAMEFSESPGLWEQLGDVLLLQRRRVDAADAYARAAEHPAHQASAAFKAARCYYLQDKYALAMKYIDRAAEAAPTPEVQDLRKQIEDARFGPPAGAAPSPLGLASPNRRDANTPSLGGASKPKPTTRSAFVPE